MRRKALALALAALVLVSVLPPGMAAGTGKVVFESGTPDANGVFEVTVKVCDMTVWGLQFALKYDPEVVQPVDATGAPVSGREGFAWAEQSWLDAGITDHEPDRGLIGAIMIISLGESGGPLNEDGEYVADSEGLEVYTFRFKRIKDGDTGIAVASEAAGEPYLHGNPEGMKVTNLTEFGFPVDVVYQDAEGGKTAGGHFAPAVDDPATPAKTADGLLAETVMLQIGSHAAVVPGGGVAALYYGERMVTAYAHDNRTFVPVRFVGERLGATVGWDNDTQTVIVEKDGHRVEMAVGASTYTIDGVTKTLDAPAEFTPSTNGNSRTMVPIRFVSEALGYQVEWDQARNLVVIAPKSLGWDPAGTAEGQAMDKAVTNLLMFSNFV